MKVSKTLTLNKKCFVDNLLYKFYLFKFISFKSSLKANSICDYNQRINKIYLLSNYNFSKKSSKENNESPKKEGKKQKEQAEKSKLNEKYKEISQEDLKKNYKEKASDIVLKYSEDLKKVMSIRVTPKLFENLDISLKNQKSKLSEIAAVTMKGANIINVAPFDMQHKDAILKAFQITKLDIQVQSEGNNIVIIVGSIPKDLKQELINKVKKIETSMKDDIKKLRNSAVSEIKGLDKIIGKDEAKKLEKSTTEIIEKEAKGVEKDFKAKSEEIQSA